MPSKRVEEKGEPQCHTLRPACFSARTMCSITAVASMSVATSMLCRAAGTRRRSKTVCPDGQLAGGLHVAGHALRGEQFRIQHRHQGHRIVDVDPFQAELLPVAAEDRRQDLAQKDARRWVFVGQLVEQIVAQHDPIGDVQRNQRLGRRRAEDGPGGRRDRKKC